MAWLVLAMGMGAAPLHAAPEQGGSRLALVLGNGSYAALPPIPGCVASAHVVTAALQRAGYRVTEQLNESNGRMGAALSDFADALAANPDGTAVLYACGYAVGFDGRVFLLPVSATLERKTDALTQGLVGRLLVGTVVRSKTRAGLVLLDTVAAPGSDPVIPFAGLVDEKTMDDTGFVAVGTTTTPPQGPSALAAALSAAFAQPNVEIRATVDALQGAFVGPAAAGLVAHKPAMPAYLAGGVPPAPPPPAVTSPPPATATATQPAPAASSPADRRRMQLSLQRLGYFKGRVTGTIGYDTTAAIKRYQTEAGDAPTGQLTAEQLARLLEDGR